MDAVNPEKAVSVTSVSPMSVIVDVYSTNMVGASSSHLLLPKRWFSSAPCFPFTSKKVADCRPVDII